MAQKWLIKTSRDNLIIKVMTIKIISLEKLHNVYR